jgi:hypothetical protein
LSNPRRCRFFVKNSETEISRWRAPISTAETAGFGVAVPDAASAVAIPILRYQIRGPGAALNRRPPPHRCPRGRPGSAFAPA